MSTTNSSNANPSGGTSRKVEGTVINLTQHTATPEQLAAGVVEPEDKAEVQRLLTFEEMPSGFEIIGRALVLADVAVRNGAEAAMIGGAPYLMAVLEEALRKKGVKPVYAFSTRCTTEQTQPDGTVRKVAVFCHQGFVDAVAPALTGWAEIEA